MEKTTTHDVEHPGPGQANKHEVIVLDSSQLHVQYLLMIRGDIVRVMVFNTTFNNISVISWQSVLLNKQ
jgi:hypothetical protein